MEELVCRLKSLTPAINEICRLSGCPGVSVGIMHQKQIIFKQGYGYRDVKRKLPPDEHTIYYLASLSKSFTAALIGILVEQGKMAWDMPIKKNLTQRHSLG
jgi:CubicO group peptidase (beta-lactamase class C family)